MLFTGTTSNVRPERVVLEQLGTGEKVIRLADNIEEIEEAGEPATAGEGAGDVHILYRYDEVVVMLEPGRAETAQDVADAFADWWTYGSQPEEPAPTLEQRVELIEEILLGGGVE